MLLIGCASDRFLSLVVEEQPFRYRPISRHHQACALSRSFDVVVTNLEDTAMTKLLASFNWRPCPRRPLTTRILAAKSPSLALIELTMR